MRAWILIGVLAAACAPQASEALTEPPDMEVVVSEGDLIYGVAWRDEDNFVIGRDTEVGVRLFAVNASSQIASLWETGPGPTACDKFDERSPVYADEVLTWLRVCIRGSGERRYELVHAGLGGTVVVDGSFETPFPVSGFSLDGTAWFSDYGSRICNTIFQLTSDGFRRVGVTVEGPDGTFDTGWDVRADCDRMGIARLPAVRDNRIIFAASTGAIGKSGEARLGQPTDLYLAPSAGGQARRLPLGIVDPAEVRWLDNSHVVVAGERPLGHAGTWIMDVESGDVEPILPFAIRSVSISPDGTRVVAMRSVAGPGVADEVVIFPTSRLVVP